jgi:hypothetical protein
VTAAMAAAGWALLILGAGILVLFVAGGAVAFAARLTAGPDTADRVPADEQPAASPVASVADEATEYLRDLAERRRPPVVPGRDLLGAVRKCAECSGNGCAWCGQAPRVAAPAADTEPAPPAPAPGPPTRGTSRWAPFLSLPTDGCAIHPRYDRPRGES